MRLNKSGLILSAVVLSLSMTGGTASAAAPGDSLAITQVGYNAIGADNWGNRNKEYVDIAASADVNWTTG